MPYHLFQVGQTVVAPSGVRDALIPPGPYVIVRLLPPVGDAPHYRVKSSADGHERALLEGQIRPLFPQQAPGAERPPVTKAASVAQRTAVAKSTAPKKKARQRRR